jgi:uncharacterized protein YaaQ
MKLVVVVVHAKDADHCVAALIEAGFLCTRLASFGGFLDRDNVTLLVGVDAARVDEVLDIVRHRAKQRIEAVAGRPSAPGAAAPVLDVEVGGATIFVLNVDRFERL